jgi:hypothetical protein
MGAQKRRQNYPSAFFLSAITSEVALRLFHGARASPPAILYRWVEDEKITVGLDPIEKCSAPAQPLSRNHFTKTKLQI